MKTLLKNIIVLSLLTLFAMNMTGCLNKAQDQSSMPWSRPASWENQVPGFQ